MIDKKEFDSLVANYFGDADTEDYPDAPTTRRDALCAKGLMFINSNGKYETSEMGKQAMDEYVKFIEENEK